jgi:hypothetical protein
MIHENLRNSNLRSSKDVARVWAGGTRTRATLLLLAALFAKRKTKFGGGESEGGAGIYFFPTPPFLPAPPERFVSCRAASAASFGISFKKGSRGVQ